MSHKRLVKRMQPTARKVANKRRMFLDAKKAAIKAIRSLMSAVKAAESKLKDRAEEASKIVERLNKVSESGTMYVHDDGSELGRHNPRMQTEIDFEAILESLEGYLEPVEEMTERQLRTRYLDI